MSVLSIDCALVTRTQAGDDDATTELAAQVRPIAQRYASRFFADPARAEDLAQTAMMKAFARVKDVRTPEAFQGWLLRITRNECLNELSRQRVAQIPISTLEDQGAGLEAPAGGDHDPEEAFVRVQLQSLVRQVITTLPSHYRQTLTMRALEDRSYEEISEDLGVPVAVARLWYCRARKRFRQAFVAAMVARREVPAACQAMGGDIAEMIEGTLSRVERDRVQGHLAGCHVCRQTEDELRSTAFRTPSRSWLLGLGALGVPRRFLQNASRTVKAAHWVARVALGAAGTATALAVAGAPVVLVTHALTGAAATSSAAISAAPAAARSGRADSALPGASATLAGLSTSASLGAAGADASTGGVGLLGSLDHLVSAVAGLDLAGTLHLGGAVSLPNTRAIVRHAAHAAQPFVDSITSQAQAAAAQASSSVPAGQSQGGAPAQQPAPSGQQVPGAPAAPQAPSAPPSTGLPGSGSAGSLPPGILPGH